MSKDFDIHEWRLYQANLNLLNEEEEDDFNITTDSFDVIELGIGDIITLDMWKDPYKTGGLPRSNWKIVSIDSEWNDIELENENKGNGTQGYITWSISSIQNLLKPEYKIVEDPIIFEQDDEWEFNISDEWGVQELNVGDVITPSMWDIDKIEVESDNIIRDKEWFKNPHKISKFRETRYVDIIEFDGKKELSRYFVEKWLKDNFKINFDGLNEQEDDEWDIEVGSNWNEFEGEFVITYKVEDEGYVYVQDDIKEFQRLNPGIDEFNYDDEPIRLTTTYKSRPVNMKYFISNYEDNTGHTLLPYTEEPTTEGFKKWLKDNNWDNEEFVFLYEIFSPTRVNEEYYDEYGNPVKITDKMKKRMNWSDDVSGVEVLNVKFLG